MYLCVYIGQLSVVQCVLFGGGVSTGRMGVYRGCFIEGRRGSTEGTEGFQLNPKKTEGFLGRLLRSIDVGCSPFGLPALEA